MNLHKTCNDVKFYSEIKSFYLQDNKEKMEISSTFIILSPFISIIFTCLFSNTVCKTVIEYRNSHWIAQFLTLYAVCICCVYVYHPVLIIRFFCAAFSAISCTLLCTIDVHLIVGTNYHTQNKVKRSFRLKIFKWR